MVRPHALERFVAVPAVVVAEGVGGHDGDVLPVVGAEPFVKGPEGRHAGSYEGEVVFDAAGKKEGASGGLGVFAGGGEREGR